MAISETRPAETRLPRPSGAAIRFSTLSTSSFVRSAIAYFPVVRPGIDPITEAPQPCARRTGSTSVSNQGVTFQPGIVAPRGMRQGEDRRRERCSLAPVAHRLIERASIGSDPGASAWHATPRRHDEVDARQCRNHAGAPGRGAFGPGRQVGARWPTAGKTKAHGHDGDPAGIVEYFLAEAEPLPQPLSGGIGEWPARGMDAGSRRLAGNQDARRSQLPASTGRGSCGSVV